MKEISPPAKGEALHRLHGFRRPVMEPVVAKDCNGSAGIVYVCAIAGIAISEGRIYLRGSQPGAHAKHVGARSWVVLSPTK